METRAAPSGATASGPNGGFGASGTIGSANELIPGQCFVVVACGTPSAVSDRKVKYSAGSPWATSGEFEVIDSSVCRTHGSPGGWQGRERRRAGAHSPGGYLVARP